MGIARILETGEVNWMRHDVGLSVKRGEYWEFSYIKRDEKKKNFFFAFCFYYGWGDRVAVTIDRRGRLL